MRSKEDAVDYRYFPEPDLPAISLIYNPAHNLMDPSGIIAQMRAAWLHKEYINTLIADRETIIYFHTMCQHISDPLLVAKWMSGVFRIDMFDQQVFVAFLQYAQTVSDFVAKQVFEKLIGWIPFDQAIIQEQSVWWYDQIINDILIEHQKVVDEYRWGKISAIGFLVWQMMKRTHGNLDPVQAKMLLENNIQKKSPK